MKNVIPLKGMSHYPFHTIGYIQGEISIVFSNWHFIEVRSLSGRLLMQYKTEKSIDNISIVGERYLVCDFGCDGIMSYEYKIWDFTVSKWIMESDAYTNEYLLLGQHPTEAIIALGYENYSKEISILDIDSREILSSISDDSILYVAFSNCNKNLAVISHKNLAVIDENREIIIKAALGDEDDFGIMFLSWVNEGYLVTGHTDRRLCLYNSRTLKKEKEYQIANYPMTIAVSPDGRRLLCSSEGECGGGSTIIDLQQDSIGEFSYPTLLFTKDNRFLCCANDCKIEFIPAEF